MKEIDQYVTERTIVERIVLVGPMDQRNEVFCLLLREKWHVIQSGPYSDRTTFPKADVTRFKFVAERAAAPPDVNPQLLAVCKELLRAFDPSTGRILANVTRKEMNPLRVMAYKAVAAAEGHP